jgi:hypothetical protein
MTKLTPSHIQAVDFFALCKKIGNAGNYEYSQDWQELIDFLAETPISSEMLEEIKKQTIEKWSAWEESTLNDDSVKPSPPYLKELETLMKGMHDALCNTSYADEDDHEAFKNPVVLARAEFLLRELRLTSWYDNHGRV